MAQPEAPKTGVKRGPGRPPKSATPAAKRLKTSVATPSTLASPATQSPTVDSPAPDKKSQGARLPSRVGDNKPLPTLPDPQSHNLSSDEYQTIAASGVLQASLVRSRLKWVNEGIFERYWVKPESGKSAKPVPPNNPDVKWMKDKGECRIRLEPHLFTAHVFVEERPKPKPIVQNQSGYGQHYRPQYALQNIPSRPPAPLVPPSQATASPTLSQQQDKKASPDPVISLLASRASSDPELKALMKEVATGNANQDQLKVFQRHIDELTTIIQKQKKEEEQAALRQSQVRARKHDQSVSTSPNLLPPNDIERQKKDEEQVALRECQVKARPQDQAASTNPNLLPPSIHPQQPGPVYSTPPPPAPIYQQPQAWTPPTHLPVAIQFLGLGVTDDRFLFPQYSILEKLSPQHELASFIITRKGRDAVDPVGLEPDKEYWVPVTMMVEVMYGREEILHFIRRWVKPAEEVRKHMEEVMRRCQRAPETYLAVRLPFRSIALAESGEPSKEATPITLESFERSKPKPKPAMKKPPIAKIGSDLMTPTAQLSGDTKVSGISDVAANKATSATPAPSAAEKNTGGDAPAGNVDGETPNATESGRPRRALRKSVRISDA